MGSVDAGGRRFDRGRRAGISLVSAPEQRGQPPRRLGLPLRQAPRGFPGSADPRKRLSYAAETSRFPHPRNSGRRTWSAEHACSRLFPGAAERTIEIEKELRGRDLRLRRWTPRTWTGSWERLGPAVSREGSLDRNAFPPFRWEVERPIDVVEEIPPRPRDGRAYRRFRSLSSPRPSA